MKAFQSLRIAVSLSVFMLFLVIACSNETPVDAIDSDANVNSQGLHFVELEEGGIPFTKVITSTETVAPDSGGEIDLEFKRGEAKGVKMSFKVLPMSIADSADITLGLDTKIVGGLVDMTFGPSGLTFNPHAIINLETKGLNLHNINPASVDFYYLDSNEQLIKMESDSIIVDIDAGSIRVVNARVPHFSRYAIAFSR